LNFLVLIAVYAVATVLGLLALMMVIGGLGVHDLRSRLLQAAFHTCIHDGEWISGAAPGRLATVVVLLLASPDDQRRVDWETARHVRGQPTP
jgi:hypothetical protein